MAPVEKRSVIISAMPGTMRDIMAKAKVSRRSVQKWVTVLRNESACHITGWHRIKGPGGHAPIYAHGVGLDQPCTLQPISNPTRWKRYKARRSVDQHDLTKARDIARYFRRKAEKHGDSMVNALFGR